MTGPLENHQVRLAARPRGLPGPDVWAHTIEPVGEVPDGSLLVALSHLSLDPAMRGWMNDVRSYVPPVGIGEVMRAGGAGRVVASRHQGFAVGDHVTGIFGVQEYAISDGAGVVRVDPALAPLPTHLGALGMTGMTAYFGLLDVGALRAGETVVVSGAAGAVGSIVGQLAKIKGARAVGIAGGARKCAWLVDELGFDAAIDYRAEDVDRGLRAAAPDGVDVYFDNVGGDVLDAALARLRRGARVVICGAISQYNAEGRPAGPANYLSCWSTGHAWRAFSSSTTSTGSPKPSPEMAGWLAAGTLVSREDVVDGSVADYPETFLRLFRGEHRGKLVLRIGSG